MTTHNVKDDRFTLSYALWTAALLIYLSTANALDVVFNFWLLIVPILAVPTVVMLIWFATALGFQIAQRRWRRAASVLFGPLLAIVCFSAAFRAGFDVSWVRFQATKSQYVDDLGGSIDSAGYRAWPWGSTGGVGTVNSFYSLVFDPNDSIAKRQEPRSSGDAMSPSVLSGAVASGSGVPLISVQHLDGHFYLVREDYE